MPLVQRGAALCLALVGLVSLTAPARADEAHHRLRHAKAQAAKLDARAQAQAAAVTAARARLAALDQQANAALAALQTAARWSAKMADAQAAAQRVLDAATRTTEAAHDTVNRLAANAYRSSASGGTFAATLQLVQSGDPATLLEGMNLLDQVGKTEAEALEEFRLAQGRQQRAEHAAAQAARSAAAAEGVARVAKRHSDALVEAQKSAVHTLDQLLAATRRAAKHAHARATALERAIAAA